MYSKCHIKIKKQSEEVCWISAEGSIHVDQQNIEKSVSPNFMFNLFSLALFQVSGSPSIKNNTKTVRDQFLKAASIFYII